MKQQLYPPPHIKENEVREERLGSAWLRVAKWDLGLGVLALRVGSWTPLLLLAGFKRWDRAGGRSGKEGTGCFPPGSQKTHEVFTKAQLGMVGHSQSCEEWGDICCPNLRADP